ncbi:MAG: hypothetical protein M3Q37_11265 [Gemmatimonadota bacterium]|nr:hypothetical protein [Gemmatimonadota bacterium]
MFTIVLAGRRATLRHTGLDGVRVWADQVWCLREVTNFGMVSEWYEDFSPPSEDEALAVLRRSQEAFFRAGSG